MKNVKKVYWISLFYALIPAYVIERLFWQERGITITMVIYCEIIYALVITICEVPSGMLADRFGRKQLLIVDCALGVLEFALLLFAYDFWMFAFACFIAGIGKSLSSGAKNALLYDSLLLENKQGEFERILGRITAIEFLGYMIAAISGSILAVYFDFSINYIVSVGSMSIAFLLTFSLTEPKVVMAMNVPKIKEYITQSWLFFKTHKEVFSYCLTGALLGASMVYIDEFWQLLMNNMGVSIGLFGIISALQMVSRIPGNMLAYRIKEKFSYHTVFRYIIIINCISYIAISQLRNIVSLIPIILLCILSGVMDPLVFGSLHHEADSRLRATIESFFALGMRILSIVVGLLFGYVSEQYSMYNGFLVLGILCFGYFFIFEKLSKR